jgi:lipid-A-disaccharide synthase
LRYYLIAGEASGDLHGASLLRELKRTDPAAVIRGWGGERMAAAGAEIVKDYRELAFMGFVEVVKNLPTILRNFQDCQRDIASFAPDRLVLIDYPGFNLRMARWARPRGYDISYYISPQLWAWHSSRVKQIRRNVDRMLVILPFEESFYAEHGVEAIFVGHPLLDVVEGTRKRSEDHVALLPGSRTQEIIRTLPVMLAAAAHRPELDYVIAAAPGQGTTVYREIVSRGPAPPNLRIVGGDTYGVLAAARSALVTSGTATLETALFGVPQVVCYRGSALNYWLARRLVASRINYISLVNLVMDAPVVTELIQDELSVDRLTEEFDRILGGPARQHQLQQLKMLRDRLGSGGAARRAAAAIVAPA